MCYRRNNENYSLNSFTKQIIFFAFYFFLFILDFVATAQKYFWKTVFNESINQSNLHYVNTCIS